MNAKFDQMLAYSILRLTTGMNMFMHGLVRVVAGDGGFADGVVKQFVGTPLPPAFVRLFGLTIPWCELAIGTLLVLGIATRWVLVFAGLLMASLIFGTSLRSDWNLVMLQMVYVLVYYILLTRREDQGLTFAAFFESLGK